MSVLGDAVERRSEGYAVDRTLSRYLSMCPADAEFNVRDGVMSWARTGARQQLTLLAGHAYVLPSGYKIRLEKQLGGTAWRLVGSVADGNMCHKPWTVSGGGKSEISKSMANVHAARAGIRQRLPGRHECGRRNLEARLLERTSASRQMIGQRRPILSAERSLGSVIKLLTPSTDYSEEYNDWLRTIAAERSGNWCLP